MVLRAMCLRGLNTLSGGNTMPPLLDRSGVREPGAAPRGEGHKAAAVDTNLPLCLCIPLDFFPMRLP